jgi:hypothetical protein
MPTLVEASQQGMEALVGRAGRKAYLGFSTYVGVMEFY